MNKTPTDSGERFYHALAEEYDEMTRFSARLESEKQVLRQWVERYRISSVLDAACGTGLHAILFSQLGVQVTGCDVSEAMLTKARENSNRLEAQVHWVAAAMQSLRQNIRGKFDAVFCLGNSIPHLQTREDLNRTLQNFREVLQTGGTLILQLLNYHRILSEKKRIININRNRSGNIEYIRFYDFAKDRLVFNILTIDWSNEKAAHQIHSTGLFPYRKKDLETALKTSGFTNLEYFGDMKFSPFAEDSSSNLVIVSKIKR